MVRSHEYFENIHSWMNKGNASGVRDTQKKISKSSEKLSEVRLHGELNISLRMLALNDRWSIKNGYIGMIHFLNQHQASLLILIESPEILSHILGIL